MGMISEIAIESTVRGFVAEIKKELEANRDKPDVCVVLKRLGRHALTQFEWSAPEWAPEYTHLFEVPIPTPPVSE